MSREPPHVRPARRFRSFKTKLLMLVALAVSVPALFTCLILGIQLDRQYRASFASGLAANLETFSLILQVHEQNLVNGLTRTAADNTLQITLDLEIRSQLTKYIDAQRQVLGISFVRHYNNDLRLIASSPSDGFDQWRLRSTEEPGDNECQASLEPQHLVPCGGTIFLASVVPVRRIRSTGRGDAVDQASTGDRLGYLLGGSPLANPALIAALESRQIAHPVIWVDGKPIYSNISSSSPAAPASADGSAREYHLGQTTYLGAAKTATIGGRSILYGGLVLLDPLRAALLESVLTVAAVGLALIAACLSALSLLANRLLRPVHQLRAGAAQIGSGDLSERISIHTGDELEALADQFNDMAARLQESYADLEKKVEIRTRELAQSVEELQALGEVSQTVNSTLDVETVLATIVAKAVQLSDTEAGAIYVFSETEQEFKLRATYGMSDTMIAAIAGQRIGAGDANTGLATARRQPIQVA